MISWKLELSEYVFLNFLFIFNWRVIALQCCVCFYCTTVSISYKYTYIYMGLYTHTHTYICMYICMYIYMCLCVCVSPLLGLPPTLLSHPSRSSQSPELQATLPVLYSKTSYIASYIASSHWLSLLHIVVYICHCLSLGSSHPLLPSLFFRCQLFFNSEDGEI